MLLIIEYRKEGEINRAIYQKTQIKIKLLLDSLFQKSYSKMEAKFGECIFVLVSDQNQIHESEDEDKKSSSVKYGERAE